MRRFKQIFYYQKLHPMNGVNYDGCYYTEFYFEVELLPADDEQPREKSKLRKLIRPRCILFALPIDQTNSSQYFLNASYIFHRFHFISFPPFISLIAFSFLPFSFQFLKNIYYFSFHDKQLSRHNQRFFSFFFFNQEREKFAFSFFDQFVIRYFQMRVVIEF